MIAMNYLEKLLDGVEVEWTTIGNQNVVEIANSGRKPVKSLIANKWTYAVLRCKQYSRLCQRVHARRRIRPHR